MDDPHHGLTYQERIHWLIENSDITRMTRELLLYTMRKHGRRASVYRSPEDYVQEAILRIMDGKRRYDFDGAKPFNEYLKSTIDSLVNHDLEKAAREVQLVERGDSDDGPLGGIDASRLIADAHAEQSIIEKLDAEKAERMMDPEERTVCELRRSGECKTARDVALKMGISEARVRNIERRIARRKRKSRPQLDVI
jgi:RNA polymerase sigma factor (sigma-70 family)